MPRYVELQVTSHFSFLRGSSSPEELFAAASMLGHTALGLTDWGSVAGVVRGWDGQEKTGVRMIPSARVTCTDGRALLLYPTDRTAWSRLTRLLTLGKARGGKGKCILDWRNLADHADGLVAILVPDLADEVTTAHLGGLVQIFGARGYPKDFAERTFKQIEGFGSYGFPESHAASFAKIAYASCWVKHHHPDVFCAANGFLRACPGRRRRAKAWHRGSAGLDQPQPLGLHSGARARPIFSR